MLISPLFYDANISSFIFAHYFLRFFFAASPILLMLFLTPLPH